MAWEFLIPFLRKERLSGYIGHLMDALSLDSDFPIVLVLSSITCNSHFFFFNRGQYHTIQAYFSFPGTFEFSCNFGQFVRKWSVFQCTGDGAQGSFFWLEPGFHGGERSKGGWIIFGLQPSLLPYPLPPPPLNSQALSEFRTLITLQKAHPKMICSLQLFPTEDP